MHRELAAPLALAMVALYGNAPFVCAEVFFEEKFETADWEQRWVHSTWSGGNGPAGRFEWSAGDWFGDEAKQKGIRTPKNMNYHSISAKFQKPFSNKGKDLVVQFSVKHEAQEYSFCGGGYIKLFGSDIDQAKFGGNTPYKIMFGPDLCGYDISRIHLIFNWNGDNLLRKPDIPLNYDEKNEHTHLYTLLLKPDNSYKVYIDLKETSAGTLHESWDFPNRSNDDPTDAKPAGWVDTKTIDDPAAKKPDDWVDEKRIRDPTATLPAEWDEEEDGTWEAPYIDNPKYKGAWHVQKIQNPAYIGVWKPRQIENPAFVEDVYSYDDIGGVGFELWTVNKGSVFDNILVTDSFEQAKVEGEEVKALIEKEKQVKKARDKASGKDKEVGEDMDEDDDDADIISLDGKKGGDEL
eukprot:TRINITY_DN74670_c0_g1_i1.p1 TRINITY_DN74670_c0_g1~~TRINITY_DN74670_c0_g1_i1.p1  ORF type:complete len:407 (-),score=97.11 TRINITY_DN74670_c0_g1_i1:132-1352(-)